MIAVLQPRHLVFLVQAPKLPCLDLVRPRLVGLDLMLRLQQRWPQLDLQVAQQAGHSAAEPAITEALTAAVEAAKAW